MNVGFDVVSREVIVGFAMGRCCSAARADEVETEVDCCDVVEVTLNSVGARVALTVAVSSNVFDDTAAVTVDVFVGVAE